MTEYKGTVELIGGLTPKNNGSFPLMNAKDIQVDDTGKRLDVKLAELGQGGGGSVGSVSLVDDGNGNFTIVTTGGGTVNLVDDGEGNFTLEVA